MARTIVPRSRRVAAALIICGIFLNGCGGGSAPSATPVIQRFTADRSAYYVGESARLTALFANGTGVLQPGDISVRSGQPITISNLSRSIRYTLVVTNRERSVSRDLDLNVSYRERTRAIAMPFARADHAAATLQDDRVIFFGGEDNGSALPNAVWAFDLQTERFARISDLATGRIGFIAVTLNDGDILVAGGLRAVSDAPRAELIDGRTGAVNALPNAPQRDRVFAAASLLLDGRVLITGGSSGVMPTNSVETYDPVTGAFTLLPGTLHVARAEHTSVRINERAVLIYGGYTADGQAAPPELFDPVSATSTLLAMPQPTAKARHAAHTMIDGGVLLLGGEDEADEPMRAILRFDPATSTFASFTAMATPRASFGVGRLVDSRLLVVGGVDSSVSRGTDTTELVSSNGVRRDGPLMSRQRFRHTVTALRSGKVLIVGGLDGSRRALASAEVFE